jgi:hypothetical protein
MAWIANHARAWRILALVLLVVGWLSPWVYDQVNVPAEYPCSAPFVRLEGDFCGVPLNGTWVLFAFGGVLITTITDLVTGKLVLAASGRQLLYSLGGFLVMLPVISTLLMIFLGNHRRLQLFQIVVLSLAGGLLLWAFLAISELRTIRLWGPWLYTGVILSELIMEVLVFARRRVPDEER